MASALVTRIAHTHSQQRHHLWHSGAMTLRATEFPIYAADGWPAQLGGTASQNGQCTEITVNHYDTPGVDPYAGDPPRLVVVTKRDDLHAGGMLREARRTLEGWVSRDADAAGWPDASRAAITVWLRARDRESRAAVLSAVRSEHFLTVGGALSRTLVLSTRGKRWVAVTRRTGLTIIVAAHDVEPRALRLDPIADPAAQLLGPEPHDA